MWVVQIARKNMICWEIVGSAKQLENAMVILRNAIETKENIVKVMIVKLKDCKDVEILPD